MSLYSQFRMDEKKQQEGILVQYAPNKDGSIPTFRILRRHSTNQRYAKMLERETAPFRRQIELGTLDNATADRVFMKVFCNSVLIGWEHIQDDKEELIPFNPANAIQLFTELPELYDDLAAQSLKPSNFRQDTAENDAKN